jgi:hypothetical protein
VQLSGGALALASLFLLGCGRSEPATVTERVATRALPAPATSDVGPNCADLHELRVCWGGDRRPTLVPRPVPSPPPARGFRCWGVGAERKCEDRGWASDAFSCSGDSCTQNTPRLPDDGEWECADLDGVVVCHGGRPAAGVTPGAPDVGWRCGPRRGAEGDRVCVDFSPDRPGPEPWSCRFQYLPGVPRRACKKGGLGMLGRACGTGCPSGSVCQSGHCLPLSPNPSCWLDSDCDKGQKCTFGSCIEGVK